jgi:hypothetical protein
LPLTAYAKIGAGADLDVTRAEIKIAPALHAAQFLPGGGEILLLNAEQDDAPGAAALER